jgi:tol-pal system protein YbgF
MRAMLTEGLGAFALAMTLALAAPAHAQSQNLADVRAEVTVLSGQIEQLRNELVRTGAAGGLPTEAASGLTRLDQLEAELRRLTDRMDLLTNDVIRITEDASNRVGDIEFRLTELEGGDTTVKPPPALLGGGVTRPRPRPISPQVAPPASGTLAVTEQSDFDAAVAAADAGDNARAAELFATFLTTYPGGPLSTDAQFRRGEALAAQSNWREAARSYLDAFSGAPQDPIAPHALYKLAVSLGQLGQTDEACLTLTEVDSRYPFSAVAGDVAAQRLTLACQ